jgi:ATP-dependent exoDNAse (exonuclease V) alpha subunit
MIKNNKNGDMYIEYDYNIWKGKLNTLISEKKLNKIINNLIKKNIIVKLNDIIYLTSMYNQELFIAKNIIKLKNNENTLITNININNEDIFKLPLNNEQKNSILSIFTNNISIIYGKGGTGKTHTIQGFTKLLGNNAQIFFLAPTCKAKIVMQEYIGESNNFNYYTLHAFKYGYDNIKIKFKNYNNNIFIVDESSMIY